MLQAFPQRQAFSLIELSIVLVILGLLTGGVLSGRSLIRAAEIRAITSSAEQFRSAFFQFKGRYFAMPGDMANATDFWGSLGGDGRNAACQDLAATGRETCNGDGNGYIDSSDYGVTWDERFRFWRHLANAGLVEGTYTGRTTGATGSFVLVPGTNAPVIRGLATADPFSYREFPTAGVGSFDFAHSAQDGHVVLAYRTTSGTGRLVSPQEAWNIDMKLDDGVPARGVVVGPKRSWTGSPNCTTSDDPATATYALDNDEKICRFNIRLN